jgi:hypothetical protein
MHGNRAVTGGVSEWLDSINNSELAGNRLVKLDRLFFLCCDVVSSSPFNTTKTKVIQRFYDSRILTWSVSAG